MSRNAESRFALAPQVGHSRSTFNRDYTVKTSSNVGDLFVIGIDEILPGDTYQLKTNSVVRFTPMVSAPMDDLYLDTYWFYCPNRIVYDDWIHFFGQDDTSAWTTPPAYKVPTITAPAGGFAKGSLADYMGIPTGVSGIKVNALPFRMYAKIYDEFFRDENVQDHINCPTDGVNRTGSNGSNYVTDICLGGMVPKANRLHDYFSSVLPKTQKSGSPASIVLGDIPVTTKFGQRTYSSTNIPTEPLEMYFYNNKDSGSLLASTGNHYLPHAHPNVTDYFNPGEGWNGNAKGLEIGSTQFTDPGWAMVPNNLIVNGSDVGISVPELRTAFQIQKFLEQEARTGSRYTEILHGFYSVSAPDYRLQRPEYLGGSRNMISVASITSNNAPDIGSTTNQPLGTVAGYSLTANSDGEFIKSFTEHGFIIGLGCVRYKHTYQQGLAKFWTRGNDRTDYYLPVFANISEQPVMSSEIYCDGTDGDKNVFGYQEAWADYRFKPSIVTSSMRSNTNSGLDIWHYADNYSARPTLSDTWMFEDHTNIDRSLAVSSATAGFQFYADFLINQKCTRLMPLYSVPGLVDHN